ncbi:hypothetical protein BHM03_00053778 [Ensete ventricosum]|nr:hypothetical protein BHM03_00053778 [Ensete ventricosum]
MEREKQRIQYPSGCLKIWYKGRQNEKAREEGKDGARTRKGKVEGEWMLCLPRLAYAATGTKSGCDSVLLLRLFSCDRDDKIPRHRRGTTDIRERLPRHVAACEAVLPLKGLLRLSVSRRLQNLDLATWLVQIRASSWVFLFLLCVTRVVVGPT